MLNNEEITQKYVNPFISAGSLRILFLIIDFYTLSLLSVDFKSFGIPFNVCLSLILKGLKKTLDNFIHSQKVRLRIMERDESQTVSKILKE